MSKRRDFLKKSVLGTIGIGVGAKLLAKTDPLAAPPIEVGAVSWADVRAQFLLTDNRVYMNTASLGPSPKSVIQAVQDWTMKLETVSETGHSHTKKSRELVANTLNADIQEIAFTRNTTEGVNIIARGLELKAGDEVIMSNHEHVGGASPWMALEKEIGIKIKLIELDLEGEKNFDIFKAAVSDNTKLLFFSHVTCTNGMRLPVKDICDFARQKGVLTCVDGAQAMGQIKIDLHDLDPDFYVTSGHKWLLGPKGTGLIYIKKNKLASVNPTFVGAYTVENFHLDELTMDYVEKASREEYGTRSTPVIKGIEESFNFLNKLTFEKVEARGLALADHLQKGLRAIDKVEVLSPSLESYRSAIVTFRIKDKDYPEVQNQLLRTYNYRLRGIYEADLKAIRVSCGIHINTKELDGLIKAVSEIAKA